MLLYKTIITIRYCLDTFIFITSKIYSKNNVINTKNVNKIGKKHSQNSSLNKVQTYNDFQRVRTLRPPIFSISLYYFVHISQIELDNTGYGNDLDSTRDALEFHKVIHQEVMDFQADLGRLMSQRESLSGQEASLYREALSRLELAYSQLRVSCFQELQSSYWVGTHIS